MKTALQGEVLV